MKGCGIRRLFWRCCAALAHRRIGAQAWYARRGARRRRILRGINASGRSFVGGSAAGIDIVASNASASIDINLILCNRHRRGRVCTYHRVLHVYFIFSDLAMFVLYGASQHRHIYFARSLCVARKWRRRYIARRRAHTSGAGTSRHQAYTWYAAATARVSARASLRDVFRAVARSRRDQNNQRRARVWRRRDSTHGCCRHQRNLHASSIIVDNQRLCLPRICRRRIDIICVRALRRRHIRRGHVFSAIRVHAPCLRRVNRYCAGTRHFGVLRTRTAASLRGSIRSMRGDVASCLRRRFTRGVKQHRATPRHRTHLCRADARASGMFAFALFTHHFAAL